MPLSECALAWKASDCSSCNFSLSVKSGAVDVLTSKASFVTSASHVDRVLRQETLARLASLHGSQNASWFHGCGWAVSGLPAYSSKRALINCKRSLNFLTVHNPTTCRLPVGRFCIRRTAGISADLTPSRGSSVAVLVAISKQKPSSGRRASVSIFASSTSGHSARRAEERCRCQRASTCDSISRSLEFTAFILFPEAASRLSRGSCVAP